MTDVLPEVTRLARRDIREAARLLTDEQARYLVDYYYSIQDFRIQAGNQVRAARAGLTESAEPMERASSGEGAANIVRAEILGSTELIERVAQEESAANLERAVTHDSAGNQERALTGEGTVSGERAADGEGADLAEQATLSESTVRDERADMNEGSEGEDRAGIVESAGMLEPHSILSYTFDTMSMLEGTIQKALDDYSTAQDLGRWAKSITGIGPVIAAGLLAHIDIERAPTAGHIWSFAGLNPDAKWLPKTKRPWNAKLKTLCWKIGESFVKVQALNSDVYGKVYATRKAIEWERNLAGVFADQAARSLEEKNFREGTDAHTWYSGMLSYEAAATILELPAAQRVGAVKRLAGAPGSGVAMLPPARIHLRSTRYAVKLFLAHYQHVGWELAHGEPPVKPYIIEHGGHVHFIAPPNWPMEK